jgi:hypothetical protein
VAFPYDCELLALLNHAQRQLPLMTFMPLDEVL